MKVKVHEMMAAYEALVRLSKKQLPARAAYWIVRLIAKMRSEYEAANGRRNDLIQKHGKHSPDAGGTYRVQEGESMAAFIADFEPIIQEEIELDCPQIKIEVFGDSVILPTDILALDKWVVQD